MARLPALPSIDIIRGFKGVLDFYLWKGLPCVRSWPHTPPHRRTPGTIAAADLFGEILKSYRLLADTALEAFREEALDQPRTARDLYVSAVLGHLHEASMSDFLTLLQESRDFLEDITTLLLTDMLSHSTTPTVYNVTMTLANTEYSQALPANTKKFLIKCQTAYAIRVAFAPGETAVAWITVPSGAAYWEDLIQPAAVTLYFRCATAGQPAEIAAWS